LRFNLSHRLTLIALLLTALLCPNSTAQTQREKPTLKDFGSSLKKLKWDAQKNETVNIDRPNADGASDDDVVRIETSLVVSDVLVTDKQGHPIRNLTPADFAISEDGVPQQVGHFVLGDNGNLARSIVLIIDYSRSQFPYIADSIEAAKVLVDKLRPHDQMAIVTDDVEMLVGFTSDKRELKQALDSLVERNKGSRGAVGYRQEAPAVWP
jgi:hypothetical protein